MSHAVALNPAYETRWTITRGPMRGAVRVMATPHFTIGRNPECEFIITDDPKCSRRHAGVRLSARGCEITSLNDKNPVVVNGREIETAVLQDGDLVGVGETELQFSLNSPRLIEPGGGDRHLMMAEPIGTPQMAPRPRTSGKARSNKKPGGPKRLIVYGVIGLILFWLFGTDTKKKVEVSIRTEQQSAADIEAATKIKEARELENNKRLDQSINSRQAQENYVRGFRDYRKGQYERSLVSFQACLALDPNHGLCNRYLRLSQRKFNELIQYYVLLGRKYRDQNQFQSCRAAFRNVMVMVKDANNDVYKLAKANYEACNAFIEGRF